MRKATTEDNISARDNMFLIKTECVLNNLCAASNLARTEKRMFFYSLSHLDMKE